MTYAVKGTFWILLGKGGKFLISLATMVAFAYWIPKEIYGTYQFVLAGLGIAGIFALSGMNTALIKSIARGKEGTLTLVVKEKIRWGLLGSLGLFLVSIWYLLNKNLVLAGGFALTAIFLPLIEAFALAPVFWNGKKRFDIEGFYKVAPAALSFLIILPAIYLTDSILWIISITLGSRVLFDGLFLWKTIKKTKNNERDTEAVKFGKNLTIMDGIVRLGAHMDKVVLWKFLGPIQVAIYSFALFPIKSLSDIVPVQALALPKLGEKNIKDIKHGLLYKFRLLFLLSIPATILAVITAPVAYKILFPQYMESVIYFQILSLIIAILPFNLLVAALISDLRKKELYVVRVGSVILRVGLFLVLTPFYGIFGVAGALLVSEIFRVGTSLYYFLKL